MKYLNSKEECMSYDELRALQSRRLCEQVRRSYERVECFRRRMDEKGLRPGDIRGVEDLHLLGCLPCR